MTRHLYKDPVTGHLVKHPVSGHLAKRKCCWELKPCEGDYSTCDCDDTLKACTPPATVTVALTGAGSARAAQFAGVYAYDVAHSDTANCRWAWTKEGELCGEYQMWNCVTLICAEPDWQVQVWWGSSAPHDKCSFIEFGALYASICIDCVDGDIEGYIDGLNNTGYFDDSDCTTTKPCTDGFTAAVDFGGTLHEICLRCLGGANILVENNLDDYIGKVVEIDGVCYLVQGQAECDDSEFEATITAWYDNCDDCCNEENGTPWS